MISILSRIKIKTKHIVYILIFMLITAVGMMLLPSFLAKMIDEGVAKNDFSVVWGCAIAMIIVAVLICIAGVISAKLAATISSDFSANLRMEIFKKVQGYSLAEVDKFGIASLVTRSTADVTNVQQFIIYVLQFGILAPLMIIVGLSLASAVGGQLSVVLSITIPILVVCCMIIIVFVIRLSDKLRIKLDNLNKLFLESLEGVRVIRAFNKQKHEMKRFKESNKEYTKVFIQSGIVTGILIPIVTIIFGLTTTAVMALGTYYVAEGEIEVGALIANNQYISTILISIVLFTIVIVLYPRANTCAKRINELLSTESSMKDGKFDINNKQLKSTVEFKNVTFSYPNADVPVLKNISFEAKPGEFVAIIGRTGAGKSTILKLIPRFYDTILGEVLVDGVNVKNYKIKELRDIIGYVPQKNVLFSGDIASNLNYGKNDGDLTDWTYASQIACADEFIDKKDKQYYSEISQGGTNLSGGQRQRMAIARAVIKRPEIYIFDDSFSALDMKTDRQLRTNLKQNIGDATVIMVAQRISSIIDADRILVLENNEIVGNGKHKELLRNCPLYREIAVLQLGEEEVRNEEK